MILHLTIVPNVNKRLFYTIGPNESQTYRRKSAPLLYKNVLPFSLQTSSCSKRSSNPLDNLPLSDNNRQLHVNQTSWQRRNNKQCALAGKWPPIDKQWCGAKSGGNRKYFRQFGVQVRYFFLVVWLN